MTSRVPGPESLVATWLARLNEALTRSDLPAVLALRGKLARTFPPSLGETGQSALTRCEQALLAREPELQPIAEGLNLAQWRANLIDLALDLEEVDLGSDALDDRVIRLLDALDDAELIWATADRSGGAPPALRADLDRCVDLLIEHADLIWAAADHIRALAASIRPDLPTVDPRLARTTRKFDSLLIAFEEIEADFAAPPPFPFPGDLVPPLASPATPRNRVPPLPTEYALQAGTESPLPAVTPYTWRSPDGRRTALLAIPQFPPPDRQLRLVIDPAEGLIGKHVLLGGLRGQVEAGGQVRFDWDDVIAVGEHIDLLKVQGREPWPCLTPTTPEKSGGSPGS